VSPGPPIALFTTLLPTINRREQQNILHHLINHCVRLINRGVTRHRQELFELYRLGIENDLLIENNRITEIAFSNIVAVGASLQAFDWTRGFIDRYAGFLKEETREDVKALSLALWYFHHKLYGLAEHALLGHGFSDLLNLLKSRCLLIRTYFEQFLLDHTNYFFLIDQIEAFEKFIRRNKQMAKDKTTTYLNFLKLTKKLAQKRFNKEDGSALKQQLAAMPAVSHREWLVEKMEGV
jgi:hypothetical protein